MTPANACVGAANVEERWLMYARWVMLRLLASAGEVGLNGAAVLLMLEDFPGIALTAEVVQRQAEHLAGQGLAEMGVDFFGAGWYLRLTAAGGAVVEYRCAAPHGILRPPRGVCASGARERQRVEGTGGGRILAFTGPGQAGTVAARRGLRGLPGQPGTQPQS